MGLIHIGDVPGHHEPGTGEINYLNIKMNASLVFMVSPFLRPFRPTFVSGEIGRVGSQCRTCRFFLGLSEPRYYGNDIDMLLRDESNKVAVIIENKIGTEEHSDQLRRYFATVESDHKGWKILGILLSPDGTSASDPRYLPMNYAQVRDSVTSRRHGIPEEVRFALQDLLAESFYVRFGHHG